MSIYNRRGFVFRILYLLTAMVQYVFTLAGRHWRGKTVVLCYHGVKANQKERFLQQMAKIRNCAVSCIVSDHQPCRRADNRVNVCITFDDAFSNLLDNALPALEEYRIPAILFVVAENIGCPPLWHMPNGHPDIEEITMSAEQLVNLSKNPLIQIGSHTLTHPDLKKCSDDQILAELTNSKSKLENQLACSIEDLALPYGSYRDEVPRIAQEAGYKRIYTLDPVPVGLQSDNPILGRYSMSPDVWKIEFLLTCAGAYSWLYPWRRFLRWLRSRIH